MYKNLRIWLLLVCVTGCNQAFAQMATDALSDRRDAVADVTTDVRPRFVANCPFLWASYACLPLGVDENGLETNVCYPADARGEQGLQPASPGSIDCIAISLVSGFGRCLRACP